MELPIFNSVAVVKLIAITDANYIIPQSVVTLIAIGITM